MTWYSSILDVMLIILTFVWKKLTFWLSIFFILPLKETAVFWILLPIWINLIFTDFFQEKHGTQLGNAITNGAVMLWVGIDWIRHIVSTTNLKNVILTVLIGKYFVCLLLMTLGVFIIVLGINRNQYIKYVGRVRETSYLMIVFSPVIYNITELSWNYFFICIIFFPIFYFIFELIDKLIPSPLDVVDEKNTTGEDGEALSSTNESSMDKFLDANISATDINKTQNKSIPSPAPSPTLSSIPSPTSSSIPSPTSSSIPSPTSSSIPSPQNKSQTRIEYNYKSQGGNGQYTDQEEDNDFF